MNIQDHARRVLELERLMNQRSWSGAERMEHSLYTQMAADFARAYLAECEAREQTQQKLDAATVFIAGLTRLDWRDFRDDDFGEGQANAFQQIQRKASDFLSSVHDGPRWEIVTGADGSLTLVPRSEPEGRW